MSQFLKVKTAEEVLAILGSLEPLESERVALEAACGRVLAEAIRAPESVPHFNRASMDGYAVRARDTFGASESLPALLEVSGEIAMGEASKASLAPGKAIGIPTGGMLPEGADAVSMVEYSQVLDAETIEITRPVAPGDNVLRIGEDIAEGEALFAAGWRLRPQDVGVLAALGIPSIAVRRRPRVAIVSTGDEIVPVPTRTVPPGKIRDINSYSLAAQVEAAGAVVGARERVPDDLAALVEACRRALDSHDVLMFSGGSSVGSRDYTVRILEQLPGSELLAHGVAIRPGKPTILARIGRKLFWGLPGQPVSAMMICRAFVLPSLAALEGSADVPRRTQPAILSRPLPSVHGRTDYVPVIVSETEGKVLATPVFGKSAMISLLARSDGYVIVPEHVEGLDQGSTVEVVRF